MLTESDSALLDAVLQYPDMTIAGVLRAGVIAQAQALGITVPDMRDDPKPAAPETMLGHIQRYVDRAQRRLAGADTLAMMDLDDAQVRANMLGHAVWDDPPDGWGKRKLLLWSRGYLYGRAIQAENDREDLWMIGRLLRELLATAQEGDDALSN